MQKYYVGYTVTKDGTTTVGDNSVIDYTSLTTAENSRDVKTLNWKKNVATTVFDVYWYVKDTPTITATPHESETPYHWDDTPGGSSTSESSPSPLDGSGKITTTGRIRPHIPGDSPAPSGNPGGGSGGGGGSSSSMTLAEIRKYLASKNIAGFDTVDMGSEGNVILPNGEYVETEKVTQKGLKKITTIKKEYVANELDTNFSTTSYLTKGSFIRNDVTIDYTMDVHKDTPVTDSSGIVIGVQIMKHTYTVPVQMVYYQMGDVTVYEPDSGKMYNYAFPNTDGSLTNRAKKKGVKESSNYDSDTRSNGKNCEEGTRSYHSDTDKYNVKIGMNKQYKDKRTGVDIKRSAECKWYGDNGDISALQKYCLIVSDPIIADKQDIGGETGKLVKVGSDLDKLNSHQTCIGDRELDIDKNTLENTAKDQGYQDSKNFTDQVVNSWWYGDIALPSYSKVYIGTKNSDEGNRNNLFRMSDGTLFSSDLVRGVSDDKIRKCLQQWYGEYYLPADTHAVPIGKYVTEISEGVDFSENYWLRDGYLLVNFKPVSYEGGKEHLLYNSQVGDNKNKKEFINMWEIENRQSKKTDKNGQAFNFNEGDFILYDLDKNVMDDDYSSAGTH